MNDAEIAALGDSLLQAYTNGETVPPLTDAYPNLGVEDAYRVQMHQVRKWTTAGRVVAGYKVGLTSRAMQRQLRVAQADFGHLFADMILNGRDIDASRFISPRVEPEISFVLRDELSGPGLSMADVIGAVDYAIASLEIIDSRIADWRIGLTDTIADNASSGALVLGAAPLLIEGAALELLGCVMTLNGEVVATGAGGAVLGHPLEGVLWLANTLGALGQPLEAGSVVMPGALTTAIAVKPGDTVTARFAQLGSVSAHFSAATTDAGENQR